MQIACIGLKPVTGVAQVTIRRKKNSIFVISRPDVYVNSSCETYIVFGEARVRLVSRDNHRCGRQVNHHRRRRRFCVHLHQ